jgi:hypothetical protein
MLTIGEFYQQQRELEKKRKHKGNDGRVREHDEIEPAATDAHEAARAQFGAEAEDSGKAFSDRGAAEGPGSFPVPGHLRPEMVDRPYLDQGHAANSPQAEPPRQFPRIEGQLDPAGVTRDHEARRAALAVCMQSAVPRTVALPGQASASAVSPHIAAALTLGSPSDR